MHDLVIRALAPTDDVAALTALLHRAYAGLGARGLNYTAVDQSVATTSERVAAGKCFVAEQESRIVGSVVVRQPQDAAQPAPVDTTPWYRRPDVAILGQLGVEPSLAGRGIGSRLVACCEAWALEHGFHWLALDTAKPAAALQALYAKLGFVAVEEVQWAGKRYRSVIMAKAMVAEGARSAR